ncbi:MAG: hypothetical protein J4G09_15565 [Proteobacteria bacterium]|nr:hypothetical protein [Pseudomonadota bacterium]
MGKSSSGTTMKPMTPVEREKYARTHAAHIERQKVMGVPREEWSTTTKLTASTTTVAIKG